MDFETRRNQLNEIFSDIDENERSLIDYLLDDVCFLEQEMTELKKMPFISVNPKNPAMQKSTAAAKQYKERSQSYMNAMRILVGILHKVESSEQNELLKRLEEFDIS